MYRYICQKSNKTATQMSKPSYPDQCYASNSLPNDNSLDLTKFKAFADNNLNVAKMVISLSLTEQKTHREKKKMLVTSIFSFSYNVFKRLPFQGRLKSGLYGKELSSVKILLNELAPDMH